jgi:Transposase zinc-ribbon domain
MDFPLLDDGACYDALVEALHPGGLCCPACGGRHYVVHRAPVLDYRFDCGRAVVDVVAV